MDDDFEDFYRSNVGKVQATLVLCGLSDADAADVSAEAFVRAWERWDRVAAFERPLAWVVTVAFNLHRRKFKRLGRESIMATEDLSTTPTVDVVRDLDLAVALHALAPRQRAAICLRYLYDLSEHEVAEALGVRTGTASATLTQARRRLAAHLRPTDPDTTSVR